MILHKKRTQDAAVLFDGIQQNRIGHLEGSILFRAAEQSLQQAGGFFAEPAGGGTVGFLCGTDLAGHQISAEDAHREHENKKENRGPFFGAGEDIFQADFRFLRRPGQGS